MKKLILASQSPQRKNLLERLHIPFDVVPSGFDETQVVLADPVERAVVLARSKGELVSRKYPTSTVLAADTFFFDSNNVVFEKPATKELAVKMLRQMRGATLTCVTGVFYTDPATGISFQGPVKTEVTMREYSDNEIDVYVTNQPVTTWSGGFSAAYEPGLALIAEISGSLTSFTHGLPLPLVDELLRRSGIFAHALHLEEELV